MGSRRSSDGRGTLGERSRLGNLRVVVDVAFEMVRGFRRLHFLDPCVTVFGSARIGSGDPVYAQTREVAARLAARGFSIVTGGGPGLMEAANRGARDAGGVSVGCTIRLPHEQRGNEFLDVRVDFEHFLTRKYMLLKYSYAFVVMPGGFGTLDELFEALTLVQTGKIERFPVVLMGTEYWAPLRDQLRRMVEAGTIASKDFEHVLFTDDVTETVRHIEMHAVARFGLERRLEPSRLLGERRP
ncbi:MAG: TIGR00730 family Rossman fold protein [Acidobacteria bacterium]|nr:TIGR00730 family Rossman fold protein [Acidobacteriota bacterium]